MPQQALLTPSGSPAGNMDPVMLLNIWALTFQLENPKNKIISAGMGKPTFLATETILAAIEHWNNFGKKTEQALKLNLLMQSITTRSNESQQSPGKTEKKELTNPPSDFLKNTIEQIVELRATIDYGHPQGDEENRKLMATALTKWYGSAVQIKSKNILFTVGGVAALYAIFNVINEHNPSGRIITPNPHYPLYAGKKGENRLHYINVMKNPGYKLTAASLSKAIAEANTLAKMDKGAISAFLFCDPNNPLGTVISKTEWKKIAEVLRQTPDVPIILDEAYAEMRFSEDGTSLLQAAPDLAHRIILIRSATKGLSAAGERMAVAVVFDEALMQKLVTETISFSGHAPRSHQAIYAKAMQNYKSESIEFYQTQVALVADRLKAIGAAMPDPNYKTEATFYVLADLSDLMDLPLSENAKRVLGHEKKYIETDIDITYALLFEKNLMISPLSFSGVDPSLGYMRITCSTGCNTLLELTNRLENSLVEARQLKKNMLLEKLDAILQNLHLASSSSTIEIKEKITSLQEKLSLIRSPQGLEVACESPASEKKSRALLLKEEITELQKLLFKAETIYLQVKTPEKNIEWAIVKVQNHYRHNKSNVERNSLFSTHWRKAVNKNITNESLQRSLFSLPVAKRDPRTEFPFWGQYLRENSSQMIEELSGILQRNILREQAQPLEILESPEQHRISPSAALLSCQQFGASAVLPNPVSLTADNDFEEEFSLPCLLL